MSKVNKLPKLLKFYSSSNYVTQQRAIFLFYLCIMLLFTVFLLISLRLYFHPLSNAQDPTLITNLLPLTLIFLLFICCLFLLIKGYHKASSTILPITIQGVIWLIMFIGENQTIARLNTVVYVFMVLSTLPLLVQKRNYIILLTTTVNIIILIVFTIAFKNKLNLSNVDFRDYIIYNSVSFAFVGFVGFYMNKIYSSAIEQAQTDLQKRIETEKSLVESESRYRVITESLPQIIFEIDLSGRVTYINQIGLSKFGYSAYDVSKNLLVTDFIVEKETLLQNIDKNLRGEINTFKHNAIQKDKTTFPVQVYSVVILKDEKPIGFRGIAIDLTDEIKTQKIIQESEERFSSAFRSNPAPMAISEIETGLFIDVNDKWAQLSGNSREKHIGKTSADLDYWFDDNDRIRVLKKLQENGFLKDEVVTVRTKSGATLKLKWSAEVITLNDRKVMLSLISDETEKIKAEEEIRQSRELFKTLIDSSPISITLSNLQGKILVANNVFSKYAGLPIDQVIGKSAKEIGIITDYDDTKIVYEQFEESGLIKNSETIVINHQGEKFVMLFSSQVVTYSGQKGILQTSLDITDRKHLEEELKKYNEQLEFLVRERTEELQASNEELLATNEELYTQREHLSLTLEKLKETQEQLIQTEKMASLGVLTAGVAHEINNPINYIYNGAMAIENFLVDNSPENIETLKPLFEAINTGIQRVTGIVRSLNKYSRKDELSLVQCNLNEVLDNALTMLYSQYKKGITIVKEYSGTPPIILAKEGELHQVFLNIFVNAIQAIENEGTITVKTQVNDNGVSVYIKDSGIGIQSENINKIFDPFFTTKDPGKGTGLGLSITKKIVQEHKGTINCYSEPDKGTEFVIVFPQTQEA